MNQICFRLSLGLASVLLYSTFVFAGPLDDHYLEQFGEARSGQLQKALLAASPEPRETHRCGMQLKHGLKRDWKQLEMSTQTVLAKQLALPALSGTPKVLISSGGQGHFSIHYTASGTDAPNITAINQYTGLGLTSASDWATKVGESFEKVFSFYDLLGYQMPRPYPDQYYHVYLKSLVSESNYGETQNYSQDDIHHNRDFSPIFSGNFASSSPSYITIDKDFTYSIYNPATYSPLQNLDITATHEYHHAIQFGYNYYFEKWYGEATSTWFEGEFSPDILQLYNYLYQQNTTLPAWFTYSNQQLDLDVDLTYGGGYGRWIFNRYLTEKENYSTTVILDFWKNLAGRNPASNLLNSSGDIKMTSVLDSVLSAAPYNSTLSTDFLGFAKRVYTRDWSKQAHISRIPTYVPVATYATFPVNKSSRETPSIILPHYSFAYYRFIQEPGVPSLTITIAKNSGIQTAAFRKNSNGAITEITADTGGNSYTDNAFSSSSEVVLLIANTAVADNLQANFSTDRSTPAVPEPAVPSSGGSSGGCFIATAAYGSYLHPQVQLLRQFRDDYLLTNAPGRAFVWFYYRCSPPLADFIARHTLLRGLTRLLLTPLVVAVAHPLIPAVSLLLLFGTILAARLRRIRIIRSNARQYIY